MDVVLYDVLHVPETVRDLARRCYLRAPARGPSLRLHPSSDWPEHALVEASRSAEYRQRPVQNGRHRPTLEKGLVARCFGV
jgi:hypothetical protein